MVRISDFAGQLDPFPGYRTLRETSPVVLGERTMAWHVFAYDDVQRVLSDHATFSSQFSGDRPPDADRPFASSLINTDPPRHRSLRSLVNQAFTLRAVEALAPRIQEITRELLDPVVDSGSMDLVQEYAYPLPVIVISELLGIPSADRDVFKRWSDLIVSQTRSQGSPNLPEAQPAQDAVPPPAVQSAPPVSGRHRAPSGADSEPARHEMIDYFLAMIDQRRRHPGDDLISLLLAAQIDGEQLSVPELLGFCTLLLVAGNETTTNLLGNAVLSFSENPGTMERLRAQPELLPSAIEEVLRYRSPVQSMYRITAVDTVVGDQHIPMDSHLVAWIGSANRDPLHFPDPDVFDVERSPNRHLAFGQGVHFCLGAPLARLEAKIALGALLERLPGLATVPGAHLERMDSNIIYGLKGLPVTWER